MYAKLEQYGYVLPALSGVLLVLTFHPFDFWPLGFVALMPLFYFITAFPGRPAWRTFWGGFITGGLFAFALSYFTLIQFHWLPGAYLFAGAVRLLVVPITLLSGALVGLLSVVVYRAFYSRSIFLNALLAAAVYTAAELLLQRLFGGYYLATLAYAAVPLPPLLSLAALGGAPLLSFFVAWINGFLTEALIAWRTRPQALARAAAASAALFLVVFLPNYIYLHRPLAAQKTLSVAVLQAASRGTIAFGTQKNGVFFWSMGQRLAQAAATAPDLLIYPFSPVEGALYRSQAPAFNKEVLVASEQSVARFLAGTLPASTTLMTWNNLYADGSFYNEYELWRGGRVVSEYQKRELFAFMDYTPRWAQKFGLFSTPFDVTPGTPDNRLVLDGVPLGDLMCSELHHTSLARSEARRAPLIIAVGSEAMFEDDVASAFSLKAAQLRAAENDLPVVRGNILGPSGIIDRFGVLTAYAPAGTAGAIAGEVALTAPRQTLYNRLGDSIIWVVLCGILASAWYTRSRAKTLR
ncbi:MAG: hypothetical protein AAB919_02110 [Patescibacteria group bacterium]